MGAAVFSFCPILRSNDLGFDVKLCLGVNDIPYVENIPDRPRRVAVRVKRGGPIKQIRSRIPGSETTYEVATYLEDKYHVMEVFFELHQSDIAKSFEDKLGGMLEDILLGAPPRSDNSSTVIAAEIKTMFDAFITNKGMDGIQPGVPTAAARKGVNHRLKHPYAKGNPERPSFRDTGTYLANFQAWLENV